MEVPKGMVESLKKLACGSGVPFAGRALKRRPIARQRRERGDAALRMIERTRAAQPPNFPWQNQTLEFVAMRPPIVPQLPDIFPGRSFINVEIGRLKKTGNSEEERFTVG